MMKPNFIQQIRMCAQILYSFLKIAPVTFGGGYAMLPVIEREVIQNRKWMKEAEMGDALSIAGSAPGGIGVNVAIFIGYRLAGIPGAVAALLGITLPTFLIVLALCITFVHFRQIPKLNAAFAGIQCAIAAMIAVAGYKVLKRSVRDKTALGIMGGTLLVLSFTSLHPISVILFGAFSGYIAVKLKDKFGFEVHFDDEFVGQSNDEIMVYKYEDYYVADGI